jgi:hypothetical protein
MAGFKQSKGPWFHRLLVWLFGFLLSLLVFWLLGFIVDDIGSWRGPLYKDFEETRLEQPLVDTQAMLARQIADIKRAITDLRADQANLRDSMNNSRETMNEMRATYRLALDQGIRPTQAQQDALAESERLFLGTQQRYQQSVEQMAQLSSRQRDLNTRQRANTTALDEARKPIIEAFGEVYDKHRLKVAALKLGVLIPLLAVAVWLFVKYRSKLYGPMANAFGLAVALRVGLVMHDYFPEMYFRYILIAVAVIIVGRVLVNLLRTVAFPKRDWLVKQYREAYEAFLCPICSYPIRRGPLKYASWTRHSIRKQAVTAATGDEADEPYTCPVCSTQLYEKCEHCGAIRHSWLPACDRCGAVKDEPGDAPR